MIYHLLSVLLTATVALVGAQVSFNSSSGIFSCPANAIAFCAGNSLTTNIIIRCGNGTAFPGNCNDNLAGLDPVGVKSSALCYESSSTAGDAACSFNGTAYPDSGSPFQIPINASGSAASSTLASSSATITTALTFQSYSYHAAPGAVGNATGSVSILPITATETFSLVLTTASASLFPSGTPAQGLPVPYEFNGTAPKFYGTPTTGENGSTQPSPFTGAAAKKGDGAMVLGFAGIVGVVAVIVS